MEPQRSVAPIYLEIRVRRPVCIAILVLTMRIEDMERSLQADVDRVELQVAIKQGNVANVQTLLAQGSLPFQNDFLGDIATYCAWRNPQYDMSGSFNWYSGCNLRQYQDIYDKMKAGNAPIMESIMEMLLDAQANPNAPDSQGRTPLWKAAFMGHTAMVRMLLDRGADMNIAYHFSCEDPMHGYSSVRSFKPREVLCKGAVWIMDDRVSKGPNFTHAAEIGAMLVEPLDPDELLRSRLFCFFVEHDPSQCNHIPGMVARVQDYRARKGGNSILRLNEKLRQKYGTDLKSIVLYPGTRDRIKNGDLAFYNTQVVSAEMVHGVPEVTVEISEPILNERGSPTGMFSETEEILRGQDAIGHLNAPQRY